MTIHVPVMLAEVLEQLAPQAGQRLVDGTLGGGGHTRRLAEAVGPTGNVLALDRDPLAVAQASDALRGLPVSVANASYAELPEVLAEIGVPKVDGILLDLGLSSDQLADAERGFSFSGSGELDLRFDATQGEPAWRLLERASEQQIADWIYQHGEERYSRRIARAIVERRRGNPLRTAEELAELVRRVVPRTPGPQRIDPATRTFQALRIAVNDELGELERALGRLPDCLRPGGRLAIISFHSLEDRLVKNAFRDDARLRALTKKPLVASDEEVASNPRARSAKLRVAERVSG
jgi:16S rRNA (cytosine1402-N4)-methyltransferase